MRWRDEEIFVIEAALAAAENCALQPALVALTVLLKTFGLLAFTAFPDCFRLNSKTKPLGLR